MISCDWLDGSRTRPWMWRAKKCRSARGSREPKIGRVPELGKKLKWKDTLEYSTLHNRDNLPSHALIHFLYFCLSNTRSFTYDILEYASFAFHNLRKPYLDKAVATSRKQSLKPQVHRVRSTLMLHYPPVQIAQLWTRSRAQSPAQKREKKGPRPSTAMAS